MKNNKDLRAWLDNFNLSHPLVIAGPCSAETENQVLEIANQLKDSDTSVFRAGIWKPRTRPGNFEGVFLILVWETSPIKNIGAIHRGFSTYEKTKYRNNPEWQIAIDLQRKLPDLPLILDPSHIAGRRDLIFDLCQTALDLNYDGLMIETHNDPDNAWREDGMKFWKE